jgi:hypothetical protein
MVSHRLFSISSVFGGKNSKEIAGDLSARCPSGAGDVISVMTLTKLREIADQCGQQA